MGCLRAVGRGSWVLARGWQGLRPETRRPTTRRWVLRSRARRVAAATNAGRVVYTLVWCPARPGVSGRRSKGSANFDICVSKAGQNPAFSTANCSTRATRTRVNRCCEFGQLLRPLWIRSVLVHLPWPVGRDLESEVGCLMPRPVYRLPGDSPGTDHVGVAGEAEEAAFPVLTTKRLGPCGCLGPWYTTESAGACTPRAPRVIPVDPPRGVLRIGSELG